MEYTTFEQQHFCRKAIKWIDKSVYFIILKCNSFSKTKPPHRFIEIHIVQRALLCLYFFGNSRHIHHLICPFSNWIFHLKSEFEKPDSIVMICWPFVYLYYAAKFTCLNAHSHIWLGRVLLICVANVTIWWSGVILSNWLYWLLSHTYSNIHKHIGHIELETIQLYQSSTVIIESFTTSSI